MGSWTGTVPSWGVREVPAADLQTMSDVLTALTSAWSTWSPTLTNLTVGSGTQNSTYRQLGNTVDFLWTFMFGAGSAVGTTPKFTLPVAPASTIGRLFPARVMLLDSSATFAQGIADHAGGAGSTTIDLHYFSGATTFANITLSAPWTWANGDEMLVWGTYPTA